MAISFVCWPVKLTWYNKEINCIGSFLSKKLHSGPDLQKNCIQSLIKCICPGRRILTLLYPCTAAEPENGTTAFSSFSAGALTTNQRPRFHPRDFPSSQWGPAIQSRGSRPNTAECRGWAHWTCPCPAQTWDGEIYVKQTRFCMELSLRSDRRCLTILIQYNSLALV